ncbi:BRD4-interacting chromatin-remodeling complex-associated protein [Bactrocera neohumeralis]|uniref:BRD4-interacting chromatin-remodeling complex-associated protein n=1 Tax=Bactrocera neohumeralis TaxID=98809 RepID=UPI0021667A8E|nr:BRD4-interacting chromatin-remodeling complex-associated protein [Bactrocera neohumeralis]
MAKLTVIFPFLLTVTALLCSFTHCADEATEKLPSTHAPPSAGTDAAQLATNSTRYARLMKILQDPKALAAKRYRAAAQRVIARADNLQAGGMPNRRPLAGAPPQQKSRPPIMRRIQNGLPVNGAPPRFTFEKPKGVINHLPSKGPVPFNAGKVSVYRPPYPFAAHSQPQTHPNALLSQSTAPSQTVKHQQQLQQLQQHEEFNFKASPPYNGKAIVRPLLEPHDPNYRQHLQQLQQYAGKPHHMIQQHPIPQQQQLQKPHIQQPYPGYPALLQSKQQSPNRPPTFHYEMIRPHEEPVLHPHVKHEHPVPNSAGYAVYENNELAEEEVPYSHPHAHYPPTVRTEEAAQHYASMRQQPQHTDTETAAAHEAEEYIKFMNSNDYFLPKHEPNYKQLDTQSDKHQVRQQEYLQREQPAAPEPVQRSHAHYLPSQQHTQHIQYIQPTTSNDNVASGSGSSAANNYLNNPIQVSQLFYQEDPVPAIVRGSYQTGSNLFVVNSDGNKAVKHVIPAPTTIAPTTLAPAYSKVRYNALHSRTPEPLRFEFTERDAVHASYTNSPPQAYGDDNEHLRYRTSAAAFSTSTTQNLPISSSHNYGSDTSLSADDPEDDEDVQSASSDFYGRVPVRQSTPGDAPSMSTSPAPVEQKDTEEYCERMCANVHDEDEEIVCGSDGYMYTSESQMECYASCLHIDVTVQSKGSCNTR